MDDLMGALVSLPLFIPSRQPVQADGTGLSPVVLGQAGANFIAVFSSLSRVGEMSRQAGYCLQLLTRDLLRRIPRDYGLAVNVGNEAGFQIDAGGVQRLRDDLDAPVPCMQAKAEVESFIFSVHFLAGGPGIACGDHAGVVSFWDSTAGLTQTSRFDSGTPMMYQLAVDPLATKLVTAGKAALRIWSVENNALIRELALPKQIFESVAFSPDGRYLMAAGSGEILYMLDAESGERQLTKDEQHMDDEGEVFSPRSLAERNMSIAFHPDNRTLLVTGASQAGCAVMFFALDRHPAPTATRLDLDQPFVYDVLGQGAFSADGHLYAFSDWNVNVYTYPEQRRVLMLDSQGSPAASANPTPVVNTYWSNVVFTPDGKTLMAGSGSGQIFLWNLPGGELRLTLAGHKRGVISLALDRSGKRLISSGYDKTLRLWQLPQPV